MSINGSRFHVENKEESSERIGDARSRIEISIHVHRSCMFFS